MISFILGAILIFYLLGIVGRLLLRYFITKKFKQFSGDTSWQNFAGQRSESYENKQPHQEGEVFITKTAEKSKKVREKVGEYVDFEEVK